ncbi:RNA polymerase sigma factor [Aquisphaera giovannonii]|uniref:RNA polymerase sigma factor n=1 Tax=Aquisphaera giovannonii TaxID=406548 RepID=A0A5B9W660_9BACT|nr:sigma-70 family RNA polymerase sigma factor [Aquisphaera giovannonii]QEH36142.1 RNA polymerase sigma factor [Aquisphaera giovannonii]
MADGPIELLSRARAGETEALGELCALYRNYLRMIVRTGLGPRLRERLELSDVVQETLIEVVRQFPQFTGQNEAALVGWLRRLVGQKLADLGRYHSRSKRTGGTRTLALEAPLDFEGPGHLSADGGGGRLLDMLALSQTSPSEVASRRELVVLLADAVGALPVEEADILWLYHAEGLSFEAIGERVGLSRKSVRGIWARGLKRLRRTLEGPPGGSLRYEDEPPGRE